MDATLLAAVIAAIFGGGLAAGVTLFVKAKPEAAAIIVDSAVAAGIAQSSVIKDLQVHLAAMREWVDEARVKLVECEKSLARLDELDRVLERERAQWAQLHEDRQAEVKRLMERIDHLEAGGNGARPTKEAP